MGRERNAGKRSRGTKRKAKTAAAKDGGGGGGGEVFPRNVASVVVGRETYLSARRALKSM